MTTILGLSAFFHDSAAALIRDGEIVAATQEERFTRRKHDAGFPSHAIESVLKTAGISAANLDAVAYYEKPSLKFERVLHTVLGTAPSSLQIWNAALPDWFGYKGNIEKTIRKELKSSGLKNSTPVLFSEHHDAHAAAAFFPSPFKEAAILTVDGVGEWATTSWGTGSGNRIQLKQEIRFPHSLGLLYSVFTLYAGFKVNSGEYKLMGLAPYGEPRYVQRILDNLIDLKPDGSYHLNMDYFDYTSKLRMIGPAFDRLFDGPPRKQESLLTQREMDIARSIQVVTEEIILKLGSHIHAQTGMKNLCMAGGVALNCVANGRLLREGPFENIWIQPAAGDAGSAIGTALHAWYHGHKGKRDADDRHDFMKGAYLGPIYTDDVIESYLKSKGIPYQKMTDAAATARETARLISEENVIGWYQGRMEFGPRALGGRSILGDPRSAKMQSQMNLKIKFRESFRPFAPSVLREEVQEWFEMDADSDYMLLVAPVVESIRRAMTSEEEALFGIEKLNVPRSTLPAITHVDYSARIQTVDGRWNPVYYDLLKNLRKLTGYGVVINTSFNVRGEPIVESPEDAYRCFMRTGIDYLILGNFILAKKDQPAIENDSDWQSEFELD